MSGWRLLSLAAPLLALLASGPALSQGTDASLLTTCNADEVSSLLQAAPTGSALEARAVWLDRQRIRWPGAGSSGRFRLYHSAGGQILARTGARVSGADGALELAQDAQPLTAELAARFAWLGTGPQLAVQSPDRDRLDTLWREQLVLVREDASGTVQQATRLQIAGALDDRYAAAETEQLGAFDLRGRTVFALWAPTASAVAVCLYPDPRGAASEVLRLQRDDGTGVWRGKSGRDLRGRYYSYLVEVFVPGLGRVRNRVTDPYALSLSADSRRSLVIDLDDASSKPKRWDFAAPAPQVAHATDMLIYELHVRDFSINDRSVPEPHRGRYLAFTAQQSNGMQHLRALAEAGLTDVHLLPAFDFATVPEQGCVTPDPQGGADSESQQATVAASHAQDCFNWGYDPLHYTAPEGSYASDAEDGYARVREFRAMVLALHEAGLRVGMDVVYNHTSAAGQDPRSVLDRIVPGYYQRLNASGGVETSTCCSNTATEHRMMAKLMIDSAVVWARDYRIDSFRFDLMGHQPRAAMERLQAAVNTATGREVQLIGEGWNFGEVANGARFEQASQLSLNGSGIATFSDRARDAVRGGGCCDSGDSLVQQQGYVNGLFYAPNASAQGRAGRSDLLRAADMIRVGLAGSLRGYELTTHDGSRRRLEQIVYAGNQPAGYVSAPGEVVNYVENHDNQTLFDINALKLAQDTSREDRARVQMLAAAINLFSQGIAYFHAGIDTLRSKSMDRNSFDSGDWFNRLDWSYQDNHFGSGLPPASDNRASWYLMRPRLADPAIKPTPTDIAWTRDVFRDLLRIRASSTLFRLRDAQQVQQRLRFPNTGPDQIATVLAGHLDGRGIDGAGFRELLYLVNVDPQAQTLELPELAGRAWMLHPAQRNGADLRVRTQSSVDGALGRFGVPGRTAAVFVVE